MPKIGLLQAFNRTIFKETEFYLLNKLSAHWEKSKPLLGQRILHNIPLTYETLVKLESLVAAGADLTVTHSAFISTPPKNDILNLLDRVGIEVILNHQNIKGEYDIILDCCAEILTMPQVIIHKGAVELTQTGGEKYKSQPPPFSVINVDESNLKKLEAMYGTGEAFVRAIKQLTHEKIQNKFFVVFGFGKVGQGIVNALLKETPYVTVVDKSPEVVHYAQSKSLEAFLISDIDKILARVQESFCVVTATGVSGFLSELLNKNDLSHCFIANMGADNEIGPALQNENNVLCKGMAINFALNHPTLLKFLDPVFYAHNLAALLFLQNDFKSRYYPFPKKLDRLTIESWKQKYNVKFLDNIDNQWSKN